MSNDIEQAEHVLNNLRQKREVLIARGHSLDAERTKLSFSAHTGDKAARQKLDKLNAEAALHDSELRSLDSAIAEGTARVERARQAEERAQGREIAKELLKRAARLVELAQSLDDAAAIRVECSRVISEELQTMRQIAHGLGVFLPSEQQFLSLGSRAEVTSLMEMPFHRIVERIAPNERRSHSSYVQPWRDAIAKGCAALLGDKQEAA
jgi:DNA repair exonuclease SbcCD ATPase subunit